MNDPNIPNGATYNTAAEARLMGHVPGMSVQALIQHAHKIREMLGKDPQFNSMFPGSRISVTVSEGGPVLVLDVSGRKFAINIAENAYQEQLTRRLYEIREELNGGTGDAVS